MSEKGRKRQISAEAAEVPLLEVLQRTTSQRLEGVRCRVDYDIPATIRTPGPTAAIDQLVGALIDGAVSEAGDEPLELLITACPIGNTVEIEIADNGPPLASRTKRIPWSAAPLRAHLYWQDCPQGGVAVTAIIPVAGQAMIAAA